MKLASGTKVIEVSARQLEKVRLPVPSIEAQPEIVGILDLDTFAELGARRRQYEHLHRADCYVGRFDLRDLMMLASRSAACSGMSFASRPEPWNCPVSVTT